MYCDCHCTAIHSWFYCHSKFCHSCRSHFKRERSLWGYTPEACGRHTLSVKVHSRGALRQKLLKPISPYFTVHTVYQKVSFVKKSKWLHDSCVQPAPSGFTQILASVLRMLVHTVMYLISLVPKLGLRHHFPSTSATVLFCNCRPTKQESILFGLNYLWHSITC